MKKILVNNKGITLVALVITIIVLLILAGVAINLALDSDGLFSKANEAVEKWNSSVAEEDRIMQNILEQMNEINGETVQQGSISLNKSTLSLEIVDGVNAQEILVATKENISGTVTWTSSVPTVATVDSNGKVTTVGEGETTITASCGGYSATCSVTVVAKKSKYTVTFFDDDKTTVLATVMVEKGNTAEFPEEEFDLSGPQKIFMGWVIEDGSEANLENITEDLNVYAFYGECYAICFVTGTKVLTEVGLMNIEDIQIGTKVYSMDEETGKMELKIVKNISKNIVNTDMCKLYINGGEIIESTSIHRFYVVNKGWVKAKELNVGDILLKADGTQIMVENLEIIKFNENPNTVYNLEVEDNHNYFVGDNSVLVKGSVSL